MGQFFDPVFMLATQLLPSLGAALSFLAPVLGPIVVALISAGTAMKIWGMVTGVAKTAMVLYTAAVWLGHAAQLAYMMITNAAVAKLVLWTAAQYALNLAMSLNPIGLVVIAIGLLVAAFVLAWNHSETFRNIVTAAWEGVKTAAGAAWEFLKGVFQAIIDAGNWLIGAFQEVGRWGVWLWQEVMVPAWNGIVEAVKFAITLILTVILTPFVIWYQTVLGPVVMWFWQEVVVPAWQGISDFISFVWTWIRDNIFTPIVNFYNGPLTTTTNAFLELVRVVWQAISDSLGAAWSWILANVFQPIADWLGPIFSTAWNAFLTVVTMIWEGWRIAIEAGWAFVRDNIWTPLVDFITKTIPEGFRTGTDAIGRLWDSIKAKLRDPLQAAINVVWNNGIVKVWNQVADLVGLGKKLSPYNLPGYARGGPIKGGIPGKDSVPILAQQGEYVLSRPAVAKMGGIPAVDMLHRMMREGGGRPPAGGPNRFLPGYAAGGPVVGAGIFDVLGGIWDALTDIPGRIRSAIGGAGDWGEALVGFGVKAGTSVLDFLKQKVADWLASFVGLGGPGGGGGVVAGAVGGMMAALHAVFPGLRLISGLRPGSITATGNKSYHSMGRAVDLPPSMAVFEWIRQNYPNSRELIFSPAGSRQIHNGRPHVYSGVTKAMHYDHVHWAMDQGGLAGGTGVMLKNVIAPERVLSPRQTEAFDQLVGHLTRGPGGRVLRDGGVDTPGGRDATASGPYIGQVVVPVPEGAGVDQTIDAIITRARHEAKRGGRYGRP
jgi:phage-related protein